MWYLYLDESGDLGFDFINKNPSKFFTVTILALRGVRRNRQLIKGVEKTLRRKLNPPGKRKRLVKELKGSSTTHQVKAYFFKQIKDIKFALYSISLNKERVYDRLKRNKSRVYNYITRKVLDEIPFEHADTRIYLVIDKSKGKPEIKEFNSYIKEQLKGRIEPNVPLDMYHRDSQNSKGLQAADMFCWGIFQIYERQRNQWFNVFKEKVVFNEQYL